MRHDTLLQGECRDAQAYILSGSQPLSRELRMKASRKYAPVLWLCRAAHAEQSRLQCPCSLPANAGNQPALLRVACSCKPVNADVLQVAAGHWRRGLQAAALPCAAREAVGQ